MNAVIEEIAVRRRKFQEGLKANKDDINLDIFQDFYPDQAHFVFELLQNAEDAGATDAAFTLEENGCQFEHNGSRTFTAADVNAITGIHNSTKSKTSDQIGKFGVGFKSVFDYTMSPFVYSGEFCFKISDLILPEEVECDPSVAARTRFWLPFNGSRKPPEVAYAEVKAGLSELAETTLLFLSHLETIRWQIGRELFGEILRVQHSENHFEVLKQIDGRTTTSSHFLKFDEPVECLQEQKVAVAFALDYLPDVHSFDHKKPLAKQLKIVPASSGRVSVYFPAKKETSGLRFHLHAPFVPELSRASIKETPENTPLFKQLATLTAASLHHIRELGLLSTEFLGVLPNPKDPIPDRYSGVRAAIVHEMNNRPLTPSHAGTHLPARNLRQARASLKELLTTEDLQFLSRSYDGPAQWASNRWLEGTDTERFMTGLAIQNWDTQEFVAAFVERAEREVSEIRWNVHGDRSFSNWLSSKSADWHQRLYSFLYAELIASGGCKRFEDLEVVRLNDNTFGVGRQSFFPSDVVEYDDVLPRVDVRTYTSGKNKKQQEDARKFLEAIGVREVREAEQVEAILKQRYRSEPPDPKEQDLERFIDLVEKDAGKNLLFKEYLVFEGKDGRWHKPSGIFLDRPFFESGLTTYYDALGSDAQRVQLSERYQNADAQAINRLAQFAQAVGAQSELVVQPQSVDAHPSLHERKRYGYGRRTWTEIDEDWNIPYLSRLLKNPTRASAQLIWSALRNASPDTLMARYRPNQQYQPQEAPSSLVLLLRERAWVPQGADCFVRPAEASRDLLPEGFALDTGWPWIKAVEFEKNVTERSEKQRQVRSAARELGFPDVESLERAKRFTAIPLEEQERFFADWEHRNAPDLPEHESANPERRAARVRADAVNAPERSTVERLRSLAVGEESVKEDAAQYLLQQYTNGDDEMICQVCKKALPFKLDDGREYFEKVEFLPVLERRHFQNYLALCPNHAAMFKHANGSADLILDMFRDLTGSELEIVLAQTDTTIYFTRTHLGDLLAVISAEESLSLITNTSN